MKPLLVGTGASGRSMVVISMGFFLFLSGPALLFAGDGMAVEQMIQTQCAGCHKFKGQPESRFHLKAPDLMWGGSKFKREWLIRWLTGKEEMIYAKSYRWDQGGKPDSHMTVSQSQAEMIADYFGKNLQDPSVRKNSIDLSTFSKTEAAFGEELFKKHSCIGCHQIIVDGKKTGGPQSASFLTSGKRLNADWIYRFNSNPPDFVPHSGEFVADVSLLGLRYITGFIATRGLDDFPYYQPWESKEFESSSVKRGSQIYKEYCSQCHGATGKGDGPAASGLKPKPAVHANIPFEKLPMEYLYNVIYYGGKSVGKSPNMPYWGLTIRQQGVADVMAYLKATFKGAPATEQATHGGGPSGVCPQPRKTKRAPGKYRKMVNPLPPSKANFKFGKRLFLETATPLACKECHGLPGDGQGPLGASLNPHPRNFTCGSMMRDIPDGQLFWIIKNGSPGTGMMAFPRLKDEQVWQLIQYIRTLAQ